MRIKIDFRLLQVFMDLGTLESYYQLIEEQIVQGAKTAEREFQDKWQALNYQDEAEWDLLRQEQNFQVEFVLPRILRGPFLVTLFTVYDTAVTEIAKLVQERQGIQISLDDLRGDLLSRAKKY